MAYSTTAYHTCKDEGGLTFLKQEAPFEATEEPLLSIGYYFWEFYEDDARQWAKTSRSRFPRGYAILRCQLELQYVLDLSHPLDIDELNDLEQSMIDSGRLPDERLPYGELIQFLRNLDDTEIFPYDSVRMRQEPRADKREYRPFTSNKPHQLLTNPQFIICTFEKTSPPIRNATLVYPEHYRGR